MTHPHRQGGETLPIIPIVNRTPTCWAAGRAQQQGQRAASMSTDEGPPSKKMIARYTWHQESSTNLLGDLAEVDQSAWVRHPTFPTTKSIVSSMFSSRLLGSQSNVLYLKTLMNWMIISVRSWRVRLIKAQSHLTWPPPWHVLCTLRYIVASHLQNLKFDDIWFFKICQLVDSESWSSCWSIFPPLSKLSSLRSFGCLHICWNTWTLLCFPKGAA